MDEQDFAQLKEYAAAVFGGTDEPVPFTICWFGAIAEIEIDPDADDDAGGAS